MRIPLPPSFSFDGVIGAAPTIRGEALVRTAAGVAPVLLKGIDPVREAEITEIGSAVKFGSLAALATRPAESFDGIVIGTGLAQKLGGVKIGDPVEVVSTTGTLTVGGMVPKRRPFTVVAIVEFGFESTDSNQAFVTLESAAAMLARDGPDIVQLKLADRDRSAAVRDQIEETLGPGYFVQDWTELNASLYSALWLEKVAISFTIGLIIMVAALNIIASLVLMVMEKNRDIAILRTMGATRGAILRIFLLSGVGVGIVGTVLGVVLAVLVSGNLETIRQWLQASFDIVLFPQDVYFLKELPARLTPGTVIGVVLFSLALSFLATSYSAWRGARLDPVEALRYE